VIPVHQVYNKCISPLHIGWAPHTVGPTPCEGVVYICCTLGVQLSLFHYCYVLFSRTDSRTTLLQQVYNNPLTWGGLHSVWGPPHVRGLLYTYCKSVVFLSFFLVFKEYLNSWESQFVK
jgi:hypothetical protein